MAHRSYIRRGSSVSLAIYAGNKSEPRNPTIARVMYSRKALESWGRGIRLIVDECAKADLPEPQIIAEGGYTKVVFVRPEEGSAGGMKGGMKGGVKTAETIVVLMRDNPQVSIDDIALRVGKSRSAIIKQVARLKSVGIVRRIGPDRGGHWEIVEKGNDSR